MFLRRKNIVRLSDEELATSAKKGDRNALGHLWDRYAHLLFGVAMKYLKNINDAQDHVIELFAAVPELLRKHEVKKFRPWLHTVMRNRCLMTLRSRSSQSNAASIGGRRVSEDGRPYGGSAAPPAIGEWDAGDEATLHECTLQRLEKAVDELDHAQRVCITLFYLERNSYKQVAEITGYSMDSVRSNIQNGRRNLRIILAKDEPQR